MTARVVPVGSLLTNLVAGFDKDAKAQNSPYLIKAVLRCVAILDVCVFVLMFLEIFLNQKFQKCCPFFRKKLLVMVNRLRRSFLLWWQRLQKAQPMQFILTFFLKRCVCSSRRWVVCSSGFLYCRTKLASLTNFASEMICSLFRQKACHKAVWTPSLCL